MTDASKPRLHAGKPQEVSAGKNYDESSPAQAATALIGERASLFAQRLSKGQRMLVHVAGHPLPCIMIRLAATSSEHVLIEGSDDNGQPVEILAKPEALVISFSAQAVS
ncbi:MAG: hypothetical protein P8R39_08195 [Alphaproteobacteria bacterium]|nr:hypothetical protein [Alphaproteobacteria bacterium]